MRGHHAQPSAGRPTPRLFFSRGWCSPPVPPVGRGAEALSQRRVPAERYACGVYVRILVKKFRDGFLPYEGGLVKDVFEEFKATVSSRTSCSRTIGAICTRITG